MNIIEPTPSQAAVVLKKFLAAAANVDIKLSVAQEALARTRGYASFQTYVASVPQRSAPAAGALKSAAGNQLWVVSGRNCGDDDDTVEVLWANDESDACLQFKLRICDYSDLPEMYAFEDDLDRPIYVVSSSLLGRVTDGHLVLEENFMPAVEETPPVVPCMHDVSTMSLEDVESELRDEHNEHSDDWDEFTKRGSSFTKMVKAMAKQPGYRLHAYAKRFLELSSTAT
jgi:hypothetical protein